MKRCWMLSVYVGSAVTVLAVLGLLEGGVRLAEASGGDRIAASVPAMVRSLLHAYIGGREIGNQMLVHNVALFAQHSRPETVETAYVGTSRTKVLRPAWLGHANAVNGSGNSYNEISYGLLLQAEVVRLRFPNIKRVYVESSLLLRRPARLILEPDHRKYLPLLDSVLPLRDQLPGGAKFRAQVETAMLTPELPQQKVRLHLLAHRADLRLNKLLPGGGDHGLIPVTSDSLFQQVDSSGERRSPPPAVIPSAQQRPEIARDNEKVQRLRKIPGWAPWDGLFDLVALWGRAHHIEVILFQPAVRSDLYGYQQEFGLSAHVADLKRVARQYGVPFINLDLPELGYLEDWTLFSDEDHMETCAGVILLQTALDDGYRQFKQRGELLPVVSRADAAKLAASDLRRCKGTNESGKPT